MGSLKKIISGSLAALMIAGVMSTGISAKSFSDVKDSDDYADEIGILSDIGVIVGTSENEFSPDEKVTREQMALLLFRLMVAKSNAGSLNTSPFTDLYDETYHGAISWANASGYILGTSATTFEPTAGITLQDAMTMIVRALGHSNATMNNGYPWTFIDAAVKLDLDSGLENVKYTEELTRAQVACILYNALSADYLIPRTTSSGVTYFETSTIMEKVFGYEIADSVLVATNNYALAGLETVAKDGYVTIKNEDGYFTVNFEDLGIEGTADDNIGKCMKVVYKNDSSSRLVTVLGATETGRTLNVDSIAVEDEEYSYVEIAGTKYQVVSTLSEAHSTNSNELLVYVYGNNGELRKLSSNRELADILGAYDAKLIFDNKKSSVADRLILKPYKYSQLVIKNDKINIAGNNKSEDLTIYNPDKAVNGDYVLYYFNEGNKTLEIGAALEFSKSGTVTRLSSETATIGGVKYTLGNEGLGISAASIKAQLTVGEKVRVIAYNGAILTVDTSEESVSAASKYLVAESNVTPVFTGTKFKYVITANIAGESTSIFVTNESVNAGEVYRYTVDASDNYTLIPAEINLGVIDSGNGKFVQSSSSNNELAFIIDSANNTTITGGTSHYTISKGSASAVSSTGLSESSINFVTDKDSTIVVNNGAGEYSVYSGIYSSTITINDGAYVVAVFRNEVGTIETLRYLYISDGSLGEVDSTEEIVKVLEDQGSEIGDDDEIYHVYLVLNMTTGEIETMRSLESGLVVGNNYKIRVDGLISGNTESLTSGVVTGYTGTTITIHGSTYKLDSDVVMVALDAEENTSSDVSMSDIYLGNVEIIVKDSKVISIVLLGSASFAAEFNSNVVTLTAVEPMAAVNASAIEITGIKNSDGEAVTIPSSTVNVTNQNDFAFTVTLPGEVSLEDGQYVISFEIDGHDFEAEFIVDTTL